MPQKLPFPTAFSEALQSAAAAQIGTLWETRTGPASLDSSAGRATTVAIALRFSGEVSGELFLCPDEEASHHTFPNADPASPENFPAAWLDLCESTADQIAQTLTAQYGKLEVDDCRLAPLATNVTSLADIALHAGGDVKGTIVLLGDPALRASLEKGDIQVFPSLSPPATSSLATLPNPPLDRVIDVPLAVTLRFGQRQLTLRELLELNTGSLVELDRQVEEPVELMLGGRVIARGEVVIVDGNYGMRVSEVVDSPARRL